MLFCENVSMQLKFIYLFIYFFLPQRVIGDHSQESSFSSLRLRLPREPIPTPGEHRWDVVLGPWVGPTVRGTGGTGNRTPETLPHYTNKKCSYFCSLFPFFRYPRFMFLIKFKFNSLIAVSVRGCVYLLKLIILTFYLEAHNSLSFKHVISKCCA